MKGKPSGRSARTGRSEAGHAAVRDWGAEGFQTQGLPEGRPPASDELGYQKSNADIYVFNEDSVRLHESLGYVREGRLRRVVYTQGEHHDVFSYGLTREKFAGLHGARRKR